MPPYTGMAQYVSNFAEPGTEEYAPPVTKGETKAQKIARIREAKLAVGAETLKEELKKYDPTEDPNVDGDPYKTLFIARVSYETSESKLRREFEAYGPVKKIRMVNDKETGKPRGYAFVEFFHTRDMKAAYKQGDGRKIENRRILVDVERGRTVPNWRPRRLGGGLGSTRIGGDDVNQRHSGRDPPTQTARLEERPRERDQERDRDRDRSDRRDSRRGRSREKEDMLEEGQVEAPPGEEREVKEGGLDKERLERSRERSREKSRDKSRARSRDRSRDREHRRDRDRDHRDVRSRDHRDRRDRERDRDRDRGEEKRERRERARPRERDRD